MIMRLRAPPQESRSSSKCKTAWTYSSREVYHTIYTYTSCEDAPRRQDTSNRVIRNLLRSRIVYNTDVLKNAVSVHACFRTRWYTIQWPQNLVSGFSTWGVCCRYTWRTRYNIAFPNSWQIVQWPYVKEYRYPASPARAVSPCTPDQVRSESRIMGRTYSLSARCARPNVIHP